MEIKGLILYWYLSSNWEFREDIRSKRKDWPYFCVFIHKIFLRETHYPDIKKWLDECYPGSVSVTYEIINKSNNVFSD